MFDPATIISGAGSLAGAILGKNRAARSSDTGRHTFAALGAQASGARYWGEKYGINPMALLQVSSPLQAQAVDNSAFGQGIANAALAVADGLSAQSAQKAYQEKLEQQNKELRTALDTATIRPRVAGIFGGGSAVAPASAVSVPVGATIPAGAGDAEIAKIRYPTNVDQNVMIAPPTAVWNGYESDGVVTYFPEGPDLENLGTGLAIAGWNAARKGVQDGYWRSQFRKALDANVNNSDFPREGLPVNEALRPRWWAQP